MPCVDEVDIIKWGEETLRLKMGTCVPSHRLEGGRKIYGSKDETPAQRQAEW